VAKRGVVLNAKPDKMISIIDDDPSVREATGTFVRSLGYRAALFASAEDFLASDGIHASACVISDVRMPGMTGPELQQRLIDNLVQVPVIFVTAFAEDQVRHRVLTAGSLWLFDQAICPASAGQLS